MDSVTQLQNYLSSITTFMTHSMQHATHGPHTVTLDQLTEAIKAEHQQHHHQQAQQAHQAKSATLATVPEGDAAATASGVPATPAATPSIPDLASPLYSGLSPSVEFAMSDRAHQLFKRVLEADVLLASLPAELGPEAQRRQLAQLAFLEEHNEQAGRELLEAQAEARLWQKRASHVLQQAAAGQLRSTTNQAITNDTQIAAARLKNGPLKSENTES